MLCCVGEWGLLVAASVSVSAYAGAGMGYGDAERTSWILAGYFA